ncbi:MAG: hypothetical protein CM15mP23_03250 [Cryomorphaceae bacterium]|nr:MAG: hypothetical protein CM15mP23_03250 [Cryomorphaceae bacterium]
MWIEDNGKLVKSFEFSDFNEAISFLNEIQKICNEVNHHPEIYNCYNQGQVIFMYPRLTKQYH